MPRHADRLARLEALLPCLAPAPTEGELHDLVKHATYGECCAAQDALLRHHDVAAALRDPTLALILAASSCLAAALTVAGLTGGQAPAGARSPP